MAAEKNIPKLTLSQLESHLFKAADHLRGKMDAPEYKEFIIFHNISGAQIENEDTLEKRKR
jgi:type I restriction-modification system DNA methylase subunit